jgi:hypothetical protein
MYPVETVGVVPFRRTARLSRASRSSRTRQRFRLGCRSHGFSMDVRRIRSTYAGSVYVCNLEILGPNIFPRSRLDNPDKGLVNPQPCPHPPPGSVSRMKLLSGLAGRTMLGRIDRVHQIKKGQVAGWKKRELKAKENKVAALVESPTPHVETFVIHCGDLLLQVAQSDTRLRIVVRCAFDRHPRQMRLVRSTMTT